jgi:diguanylate cyclase (GGDEF)-like protein
MNLYGKFLKGVKFFQTLPDSEIEKISTVCKEEHFGAGELIFAEGDSGDLFYIILSGVVEIWKNYKSPERDLLTVYSTGQSFGELALIDDSYRSATIVAREPSVLLTIHREDFNNVLMNSIYISLSIMRSMAAMIRDNTIHFFEKQLYRALHDPLTGLPNRNFFYDRLEKLIKRTREEQECPYAVLYFDVDRFNVINDSLGHVIGDKVLIAIAERLKARLMPTDILARFSGDEFAVLIEHKENVREKAVHTAIRIREELQAPFEIEGQDIFITVSIGIVPGMSKYESSADVLRDADIAMYRAKHLGRGGYQIYDETLHDKRINLLRLENDLRGAVERHEFILNFQPIISLKTHKIAGFESLVRWQHPDRGIISPEIFIPIAEETGVILQLGKWVLIESCHQLKRWTDRIPEPLFVSVNVSGKQFMERDFVHIVKNALEETGLPGSCLKLEMTESVLIGNVEELAIMLRQIREMGIRIAIDDFGTGYSSLAYLNRFPIDLVKIDRSFVRQMSGKGKKNIIETIVSMAHLLNMEIVAEGVETNNHFHYLNDYGCEYGQGYYFSKPLSAEDADIFLDSGMMVPDTPE